MPTWSGKGETFERPPQLKPGYHRVWLKKVIDMPDHESVLVILGCRAGECSEFLPYDFRPKTKKEREEIKRKTGKGDRAWLVWRLFAGFDYPNREHWEVELEDRPDRTWDLVKDLEAVMHEGKQAVVQTSERYDQKNGVYRAQVEEFFGTDVDSRKPCPVQLKPGESYLIETPKDDAPNDGGSDDFGNEVPF